MKVRQLITKLLEMPIDSDVEIIPVQDFQENSVGLIRYISYNKSRETTVIDMDK